MRTLNFKLIRSVACLCVPTAVVIALAVRFYIMDVPRITEGERKRVASECEEVANGLLEDPGRADFAWRRGAGVEKGGEAYARLFPSEMTWKDWPTRGPVKKRERWGWRKVPEGRIVWVRDTRRGGDDDVVYGRLTHIEPVAYKMMFICFGGFALFVLVGITLVGAKYLIDYVKARDDFMSATAHDLATPLVGMRFLIGRDDVEAKNLNERMIRLVENIKDFMRLGGRRRSPVPVEFDLKRAYDEAYTLFWEDYRDLFDGRDVEVVLPPADDPSTRVVADETMTVQILWNLLGNDLKYVAPFGSVKVVFRREGGRVAVDFVDGGKGMSRRQMAKAFDRFYRAKTVLESGKGGFGIGLCTAREFAVAMGGTLTVRANTPRGCIFTLTLPAA